RTVGRLAPPGELVDRAHRGERGGIALVLGDQLLLTLPQPGGGVVEVAGIADQGINGGIAEHRTRGQVTAGDVVIVRRRSRHDGPLPAGGTGTPLSTRPGVQLASGTVAR